MSTDIRLKHSKVASRVPTSGDLKDGELGLQLADEKIYMKNANGDVVQVAGKGGGDGEYVKVAGDNMTGDLTLGTDKITLDATTGAASFADGFIALKKDQPTFAISSKFVITNASDNNNTVANISNVGAAEFVGSVYAGGNLPLVQGVVASISSAADQYAGSVVATNYTAGGRVFLGQNSSAVATSQILEDGSASFAGDVTAGDFFDTTKNGSLLSYTGAVMARHTNGAGVIWQGLLGNTQTSKITAGGSATFDGNITAPNVTFNLEPDNEDNYTTTTEEYEETIQVPVVGGIATADLVDGAPERQFTEKTVTRTREIKTYTGPTLDVKEQLLAYEARFKQQDALIAQMTEALKKLGADIDPPATSKKSTKKK